MKCEAVIFDLDGTLLDTLEDIAVTVNRILRRHGLPTHGIDAYRYFVGDGVTMLISRTLPADKRSDYLIADFAEAFRKEYSCNWNVKTKLYDGVPELLDALVARQIKMAVLSNKPHDFTKLCAHEFLSGWRFEMILGQRDGVPMKPDPAAAHEIATSLGVSPPKVVYLGDTGVDILTGIHAGMFPVGALWGFRPEKELQEHGAAVIISRPIELLSFVK